ncbi:MAG: hypothetical protein EB829_01310 [Nitrosopumilus sp. H8]|nr:MAG: hypothetical protein EB829_01310 [Nitrosopumilus sp. H8]
MSATDVLREDHRQARRLEEVVKRCYVALYDGRDVPLSDLGRICVIIEEFLDAIHYSREEDSYFPCVASYDHLKQEIHNLLVEHEFSRRISVQIRGHLKRWEAGEDAREPVARYLRTYKTYLEDHMRKEDDFFDKAESVVLSKEEESDMYEQFKSVMAVSKKAEDMIREIGYLEGRPWARPCK